MRKYLTRKSLKTREEQENMFCTKCGAKIAEGSKFCIRCGAPVVNLSAHAQMEGSPSEPGPAVPRSDAAPTYGTPAAAPSPEIHAGNAVAARRKPGTKMLFVLGAAALVIIIAVLLVSSRSPKVGFDSPEEAFDAYYNGGYNHDFDEALKACPDFLVAYYGGEDGMKANLETGFSNVYANPESAIYFLYRAIGHTTVSEQTKETLRSNISGALNANVTFTDVAEIAYEYRAKYRDDGHEEPVVGQTGSAIFISGYAIKCDGRWYYYPMY